VPRKLDYTDEAVADLTAVRRWLTQPGSGPRAQSKLPAIRAKIRLLRQNPFQWPIVYHPDVRELPCAGGYQVFHEVTPDTGRSSTAGDVLVPRSADLVSTEADNTASAPREVGGLQAAHPTSDLKTNDINH
jgi:hypothetical protein